MSLNITAFPGLDGRTNAPHQIVADNLAAEMARRRMSGRKVALALGMTQTYVARRVSGDIELGIDDLFAFAGLLGVEPAALLQGAQPVPPAPKPLPTDYKAAGSGGAVIDLMTRVEVAS